MNEDKQEANEGDEFAIKYQEYVNKLRAILDARNKLNRSTKDVEKASENRQFGKIQNMARRP